MKTLAFRHGLILLLTSLLWHSSALAQSSRNDNWFQIEVTLFTYEGANLDSELWSPQGLSLGFPERLRRLDEVADALQLQDWSVFAPQLVTDALDPAQFNRDAPQIGPAPYAPADAPFTLPDLSRTPFLLLPPERHDFSGTNRALTQSTGQRIVFHGAWLQNLTRRNSATAVAIIGGQQFGERYEVEGSLNFYLTSSGDRAILESNLWLNSFGTTPSDEGWELPLLPEVLHDETTEENVTPFYVTRIIPFQQNRDLRSREFHYLDHPALGMLVQITPYELPPVPLPPLTGTAASPLPPSPGQ